MPAVLRVLEDAWGRSLPHVQLPIEKFFKIYRRPLERLEHVKSMVIFDHSVSNTRGELLHPHGRYLQCVRIERLGRSLLLKQYIKSVDVLYTIVFTCEYIPPARHTMVRALNRPVINYSKALAA